MNISNSQVNRLRHFVRAGLRSLFRPEPQTAVEWADANYYLPKESAYQEGRWETLPFQRAIMNAMGSDYIREVNVVKSARVGYSKMLLGVYAYFIEHKQRNTLIWLPTDGDAENFMKTHVEPTIRDIPSLLALAPWYGKKHRDNTLTMKRFTNGRGFWCLGGKAAKNYREKSVDVAGYDELAAFDDDIEQEGSPTFLGDKRIEGSVWPKSIRGSTPKVRGTCQIERAASESPHFMRFHVACPHCGEEQYLKFGDKETPFGLKWTPDDPSSVFYLCEHNACVIRQQELDFTDARYICEKTGIWTRDGILWFSSSGEEIEPPDSVTFHIWTAYSPFTTWVQIVKDWMKTKGDTGKRKTFVNTTLGETWEAKIGERPDAEVMAERKEHYSAPVPDRVAYLTAGIDSQLDRYEMRVWGWGPGEESWLIDRQIIMGRHDDEQTLLRVDEAINKTYTRRNGAEMSISRICWDTGGIDPTIVYERSKKHGLFRVIPISSAVDSTSESLAATPKAVKAANDNANSRVPSNRKVNGKALTADITLTPKDIGTLNSVTMSFSGGAGWFKLATVTMPQASSIVYIALIGGAGYNVGSPHQAGISELVLRAGNGNPKGITGALWKRTAVGLTNFAWSNTSGDTYDIYVEIGNYATSVNIHWDCTANASVSVYTSPTYSASKPSSVTDGVVYTMYSSHQKPTPSDIGALPTTGGTVSGPLSVTGGLTGSLNGNASTATKLQTARSIGGVVFDGSANINLPGVNTTGNQNTTGNAATATKLQTARKISGVPFDGSTDITLTAAHVAAFARRATDTYADADGGVP
ncbi:terminase gpA endonuclease subunit, partial [Escherichia coli]|uniref:terminase gpA endonuclease subunit n=1 Tax=Escherichia coli TaxID=562 RepID=UPI00098CA315